MSNELFDDDISLENDEIIDDISKIDPSSIVVYSRDWTIETIFNQIHLKNIDLNPKFQRRNAWNDEKRSLLIESIIVGYPVPEIVLAEDPKRKKSFVVIDGKQRLLTIAGFILPDQFNYWTKEKLNSLKTKKDLNGISYNTLHDDPKYSDELREFMNASLRCTIITNFKENDVLYDIFYRLNSGSVPLSTQELRQVLNRGDFANYLITITNDLSPIHKVMNLTEPDKRLRDIEVILRCITILIFGDEYKGNLKKFLDEKMDEITKDWDKYKKIVEDYYDRINDSIEILNKIFGGYKNIGRKYKNNEQENRFNRVLFEVQVFYIVNLDHNQINNENSQLFKEKFIELCEDFKFRSSIESSTKNLENYIFRFSKYQEIINSSFGTNLHINPFKYNAK